MTLVPFEEEQDLSARSLFNRGAERGETVDWRHSRIEQVLRNAVLLDIAQELRGQKSEARAVLGSEAKPQAKAAYLAGRTLRDVITDGTRTPYWLFNHPLGAANVMAEVASEAAGLTPSYRREVRRVRELNDGALDEELLPRSHEELDLMHARRYGFSRSGVDPTLSGRIPQIVAKGAIPGLTTMALLSASGNHDPFNPLQGGRTRGYQAILADENDPTRTTNAPLEFLLRYVIGRSGRLLEWDQFTQERPDVSPEDYSAARAHQIDRGLFGLNLVKGTGRNLNGEPEFTMMGFRVPLSGAAAAGGAMLGGIAGARAAEKVSDALRQRQLNDLKMDSAQIARRRGYRMVGGAALGSLGGAGAGYGSAQVVNDAVIQPTFYPERVEAERLWQLQQQRLSAVQQQASAARALPQQQALQQSTQQQSP